MKASNSRSVRPFMWIAVALCAGLLVSGCGGSGSATPPSSDGNPGRGSGGATVAEGDTVPPEASSSIASMLAWVKSLGTSDTALPYRLDTFRPPLDDTTETSPG